MLKITAFSYSLAHTCYSPKIGATKKKSQGGVSLYMYIQTCEQGCSAKNNCKHQCGNKGPGI